MTASGASRRDRAENFWYYHKWHVLVLALAALCAVILAVNLTQNPKPDWSIGILVHADLPAGTEAAVSEAFEPLLPGRGSRRKPVMEVNTYRIDSVPSSSLADRVSGMTRLTADAQSFWSFLFLTDDPDGFEAEFGLFATESELGLSGSDSPAGIPWSRCAALSGHPLPAGAPDLILTLRWADPVRMKPDRSDAYAEAKRLFLQLVGGQAG